VRDYIYVEDAVEAYLDLSMALAQRPELSGQAFNFSTETPLAALAVVELILSAMGSTLAPDIRNEARAEIPHQYLSSRKARDVLGWRPRFPMDEALARTIDWYRDYLARTDKS
jgi:CDP-glucose 4,6-dehydratase